MKVCYTCKIEKEEDCFHRNKNHSDELSSTCKDCRREYHRRHYEANKSSYIKKAREWKSENYRHHLANKYKVSLESVENALNNSDCCEICGNTESLVLDHIHTTSTVRGVLCKKCNSAIGFFGDENQEILTKIEGAIRYLTK